MIALGCPNCGMHTRAPFPAEFRRCHFGPRLVASGKHSLVEIHPESSPLITANQRRPPTRAAPTLLGAPHEIKPRVWQMPVEPAHPSAMQV